MINKFILEMKIEEYLHDLSKCINNAFNYINGDDKIDKDDLLTDLSDIDLIIQGIKIALDKLEKEYEKDLSEHNN